ncbi:MAG: 2-oxoacid:ferredoxin oxidoreductase subunit beta [Bifidobacteriaceae bacterium]|jgi:2-oxoglutarate ferredoxin oxidoreductase subunit beta|nr:2-oxoacid:ferredoxin oxidoreductase subunit beta [Bifidobacteriaceae bacterium]
MNATKSTQSTAPAGHDGLACVPLADQPVPRGDYVSDAQVRWCPGCGDYSILATFLGLLPKLGLKRENTVVVSGIGCSSRFPYYVDTYGIHSIHGRAPAIATGLATVRPDLNVWVITGDGDALSIGGNHLIHALRRNVNLTIILFNNRIYGLTKGQYSPTSPAGTITKSSPKGSLDLPFDPVSLALGAEASFVARALDTDRAGLTEAMERAARHRGAALIEVMQNCVIFADGTWDSARGPETESSIVRLADGEPVTWAGGTKCLVRDPATGELTPAVTADAAPEQIVVHRESASDPSLAFGLSRLDRLGLTPVGVFRAVDRPAYDDEARAQVTWIEDRAKRAKVMQKLLVGPDSWTID